MNQPRHSLTHRTLTGMLWTAYGRVAYHGLHLAVLAVLARLLTAADFGLVGAALVVTSLSAIVSHIGVGPALIQRRDLERRHLQTGFTVAVLTALLLGAAIWYGAPLAARFFRIDGVQSVLRVLAWTFPVQGLGTVSQALLSRELRFQRLAHVDVVAYGVGYGGVGITGAVLGWGVWALVAGQMAQSLVRAGLLLAMQPPPRPGFDRGAFGDLIGYGSGFTIARLANYVALQGDNLLTGRYLGAAALGFYGRAYGLMSGPAYAFGAILDQVLFPAMAKVQDDQTRLAAAYRRGVALVALLVLPASAALILLAPEFVRVVLGARWTPAVAPFQILGLGMLFRTSYKLSDTMARSTGAVYRRAWRQILYAALVLGGVYIGRHWGLPGVAWGALAALTVNFLLMAHLSLDVAHMTWGAYWMAHRPAALLTVVSFGPVVAATLGARALALPALATLAVGGTVLLLACAGAIRFAPAVFLGADGQWIAETGRSFIRKLRRRVPSEAGAVVPVAGAEEAP